MSLSSVSSRMRSLQDDVSRRQSKIADIMRDEARASERIATATQRLARATSTSSAASYRRDIEREQNELVRLQRRRADESRDLARKQEEVAKCQSDYLREQEQEMRKGQDILKRLEDDNRRREASTLRTLNRRFLDWEVDSDRMTAAAAQRYSAFISHATEDKDQVVRPLAEALKQLGHNVWYDEFSLRVGDSLRRSIDRGLSMSRFGIVVLSPNFFAKEWPQYELDGLVAKEQSGDKVVLPLWHRVSKDDVLKFSPSLAGRFALSTSAYTVDELAKKLHEVLGVNPNN